MKAGWRVAEIQYVSQGNGRLNSLRAILFSGCLSYVSRENMDFCMLYFHFYWECDWIKTIYKYIYSVLYLNTA